MKRFLACLMSVVLVVGLLPAVPFEARQSAWGDGLTAVSASSPSHYVDPVGQQLNDRPFTVKGYSFSSKGTFPVRPEELEAGGVAFAFEGKKAPRLVLRDSEKNMLAFLVAKDETHITVRTKKDGQEVPAGDGVITCPEEEPVLSWKGAVGEVGVECFSADVIKEALERSGHSLSEVTVILAQANDGDATVNRMVLLGEGLLPDVSNGSYGIDEVRRVYTRPVTIKTSPDDSDKLFRTVPIDIHNPIFDGADLAVRYTCPKGKEATPFLHLVHVGYANGADNWKDGWTVVDNLATWGVRTAIDEETGERVTFFDRDELERVWQSGGGKSGDAYDYLYLRVHGSGGDYEAGSEQCDIIEVVALGGYNPRVRLADALKHKVSGKSAQGVADAMRAGYNMAGHLESNYVSGATVKDGGWGQSDLALEAHWARGTFITRETIRNIKAQGFNAVRLPVTWFQHIYPIGDPTGDCAARTDLEPTERYHIDRAWMERVHEVVDWCIAEDMYVIVNIHHEDWIDRPDLETAYTETDLPVKFEAVWTQIAHEFDGYDQRLVFEDMNEPHQWFYKTKADGSYELDADGKKVMDWGYSTPGSVTTVNRLNADFVRLMRGMPAESGHRERVLMMARETGNGTLSYTGFVMPQDIEGQDNIAISVHCYTPHGFTHYFANGAHQDEDGANAVYTDSYRAEVEASWDGIRERYTSQGYTVILGEFGVYYLGEERQADRLDWAAQFATRSKELGIPMFYWRMDRSVKDTSRPYWVNRERVVWSAFDEESQTVSDQSKSMFEKWFSILNDGDIVWGSNALVPEGERVALDDELHSRQVGAAKLPATIKGNHSGNSKEWYITLSEISWNDIKDNVVAVKFAGDAPRIGALVQAGSKGDYWGGSADTIDYQKGIAYFKASSIAARFNSLAAASSEPLLEGKTIDDMYRLCICTATSGYNSPVDFGLNTGIEQVAIIHQHEWGAWRDASPVDGEAAQERVCASCGERQTRALHEWCAWKTVSVGGCDGPTVQERVCAHHADAIQRRTIFASGHWWDAGVVTKEPTCAEEGEKTYTCANDGAHKRVEAIPATGHSWGTTLVIDEQATYEKAGSKSIHCTVCGESKPGSEVAIPKLASSSTKPSAPSGGLVVPAVKLAKVKAAKRGFTAKWKAVAGVSGYELQYSLKKGFKRAKTVKVAKPKASSKKVKKLKVKKKYWVRIRAFRKVAGVAVYSSWSKPKPVTTKR